MDDVLGDINISGAPAIDHDEEMIDSATQNVLEQDSKTAEVVKTKEDRKKEKKEKKKRKHEGIDGVMDNDSEKKAKKEKKEKKHKVRA